MATATDPAALGAHPEEVEMQQADSLAVREGSTIRSRSDDGNIP